MSSLNATEESQIVILMIDSDRGFEKQDANIANIIESEGKPFVIAVNKWDLAKNKKEKKKEIEEKIEEFLPQVAIGSHFPRLGSEPEVTMRVGPNHGDQVCGVNTEI